VVAGIFPVEVQILSRAQAKSLLGGVILFLRERMNCFIRVEDLKVGVICA
jgi:hypothetical protein